jgi:YVTN family beta-propeller protein
MLQINRVYLPSLILIPICLTAALLFGYLAPGQPAAASSASLPAGTELFLPVVSRPWSPPQVIGQLPLPDAECPSAVITNPYSGYTYILNQDSDNISIISDQTALATVSTGIWPVLGAAVSNSNKTYITNLHSGTVLLDGTTVLGVIPAQYEPYNVAYNPVNGYAYIADLDSAVRVVNELDIIADINLLQLDLGWTGGWMRAITVDEVTGLVYVAAWEKGLMYIIDGVNVIDGPIRLGWGILHMLIDEQRGYLYTAHSHPNEEYPHNLSVYSLTTGEVTYIHTAANTWEIALDPLSGYVYATNPDNNSVTVLSGSQVVAHLTVGQRPLGVAVSPLSGYAFVANSESDTVTVLQNGQIVAVHPTGHKPTAVGVNAATNLAYITNRNWHLEINEHHQVITVCNPASVTILR